MPDEQSTTSVCTGLLRSLIVHNAICRSLSRENPVVNKRVPQPSTTTFDVFDPWWPSPSLNPCKSQIKTQIYWNLKVLNHLILKLSSLKRVQKLFLIKKWPENVHFLTKIEEYFLFLKLFKRKKILHSRLCQCVDRSRESSCPCTWSQKNSHLDSNTSTESYHYDTKWSE